jgi:hypothetical protein
MGKILEIQRRDTGDTAARAADPARAPAELAGRRFGWWRLLTVRLSRTNLPETVVSVRCKQTKPAAIRGRSSKQSSEGRAGVVAVNLGAVRKQFGLATVVRGLLLTIIVLAGEDHH